jgi:hypothetical protein
MKPLSRDTTPEAQRKHYELMRQLSPERRLQLALQLTDSVRKLLMQTIRLQYPLADEATLRRKFIARVLPREDVIRAFGFDPQDGDR